MTLFVNPRLADSRSSSAGPIYMTVDAPFSTTDVRRDFPVEAGDASQSIVIIEKRPLQQDCLGRLLSQRLGLSVMPFTSVDEYLTRPGAPQPALIMLCVSTWADSADAWESFQTLIDQSENVPVVVSSDAEDTGTIVEALTRGAKGYVPTSIKFEILIEVLRLVRAGGIFAPASTLLAAAAKDASKPSQDTRSAADLTLRQLAIVNALRQGKSNKVIAYELNMCESTVKVHMRNIMKKLGAKNRTEVALMAPQFLSRANGAADKAP